MLAGAMELNLLFRVADSFAFNRVWILCAGLERVELPD